MAFCVHGGVLCASPFSIVQEVSVIKFEKMLERFSIPRERKNELFRIYSRRKIWFDQQAETAYAGIIPDFPICKRSPMERLIIWCCVLPEVAAKYASAGVPQSIIDDTLQEVFRLSGYYRKQTGRDGLSKESVIWLRHIYNAQLFQIGPLQYQLFRMVYLDKEGCGEAYMQFSQEEKKGLPPGSPVFNLHIPSGTDLSEAAVEASLSGARRFFASYYPDFDSKAIVCYSWLLYPGMRELLPQGSRIVAFAARFRVIGAVSDPYGSDAVRRIYGRRYPRKSAYPQDTQLQRNALFNFEKLGMGCGVIEIT